MFKVADRMIVLRHGKVVGNIRRKETTNEEIGELIMGIRGHQNI